MFVACQLLTKTNHQNGGFGQVSCTMHIIDQDHPETVFQVFKNLQSWVFKQSWIRKELQGRSSSCCVASWSFPHSPPTWTLSQPTAPAGQPDDKHISSWKKWSMIWEYYLYGLDSSTWGWHWREPLKCNWTWQVLHHYLHKYINQCLLQTASIGKFPMGMLSFVTFWRVSQCIEKHLN